MACRILMEQTLLKNEPKCKQCISRKCILNRLKNIAHFSGLNKIATRLQTTLSSTTHARFPYFSRWTRSLSPAAIVLVIHVCAMNKELWKLYLYVFQTVWHTTVIKKQTERVTSTGISGIPHKSGHCNQYAISMGIVVTHRSDGRWYMYQ